MRGLARRLLLAAWACAAIDAASAQSLGRAAFPDRRDPPAMRVLDAPTRARFELGQAIFNTAWVPAGTPHAERRDGLGPLYIAASCDACHNNGARGQDSRREALPPNSFVMQLGGEALSAYGQVVNTAALPGFTPEAQIRVQYEAVAGRYADGTPWVLRDPRYVLSELGYGPLPPAVVLRPRIAPAVFGTGLLEQVPVAALRGVQRTQPPGVRGSLSWQKVGATRQLGRFGWQAEAVSVEDQTQRALSREMGLTTLARPQDDCTDVQVDCRAAPNGGTPEVSEEFLAALLTYQRELAVPQRSAPADPRGATLFRQVGCAQCHRPQLPIRGAQGNATIDAYTDLLVHDLGPGLADRTVDGALVVSRWRTAPLWGLAHALENRDPALLHDGRARSLEEAVLWHDGQAAPARRRFLALNGRRRQQLLAWLASL